MIVVFLHNPFLHRRDPRWSSLPSCKRVFSPIVGGLGLLPKEKGTLRHTYIFMIPCASYTALRCVFEPEGYTESLDVMQGETHYRLYISLWPLSICSLATKVHILLTF